MTDLISTELTGYYSRPSTRPNGNVYGARMRRYRATITLASQATTDNVLLAIPRAGETFMFGVMTHSASLGSAVVAIGTSKVHASNGQLRAAAVSTGVNAPALFGLAAAISQDALEAQTPIYLTIATAALPSSGTLVIDLIYSNG
jgi:hypothetical protein